MFTKVFCKIICSVGFLAALITFPFAKAASVQDASRCLQYFSSPQVTQNFVLDIKAIRHLSFRLRGSVLALFRKYKTNDIHEAFIRSSYKNKWNQWKVEQAELSTLLAAGADITTRQKDRNRLSALEHAIEEGQLDIVRFLLSMDATRLVYTTNEQGETPLFAAIYGLQRNKKDGEEIFSMLLDVGAPVDYQNNLGRTVLHEASAHNMGLAVKMLLKAGAIPNLKTNAGENAIFIAAKKKNISIARWLRIFADPKIYLLFEKYNVERDIDQALTASLAANNFADANLFLKAGADYIANESGGFSARKNIFAQALVHSSHLNRLLNGDAENLNRLDTNGRTPLMNAVLETAEKNIDNTYLILFLLRYGANIQIRSSDGKTVETLAEETGRPDYAALFRNYASYEK